MERRREEKWNGGGRKIKRWREEDGAAAAGGRWNGEMKKCWREEEALRDGYLRWGLENLIGYEYGFWWAYNCSPDARPSALIFKTFLFFEGSMKTSKINCSNR